MMISKVIDRLKRKNLGVKTIENIHLTTIPVKPEFLWDFVLVLLKTVSLYHENLFIHKFKDISSQFLYNLFSVSDIMEALEANSVSIGINARLRNSS